MYYDVDDRPFSIYILYSTVNSFEGIFAGVRPCGVTVLLSEVYGSESKSQVYDCVHNHLKCHPQVAQRTGKANSCIP